PPEVVSLTSSWLTARLSGLTAEVPMPLTASNSAWLAVTVPAPVMVLPTVSVTRLVPPAVTAAPIDSAVLAVRVPLPLLVLTAPVVVRPPVLLTVTVPGLAVLLMPETVRVAAVLVREMLPLVALLALNAATALPAVFSVVPPTELVVSVQGTDR